MEQLVIVNPRSKGLIKESLERFLYEPVQRHFKRRLDEIIIANTLEGKYQHKSFHFKGEQYHCEYGLRPRNWNKLLPHLKPRMEKYLADVKHIDDQERPTIFGFINQVLNSSNHFSDYIALFPSSAHPPIRTLLTDPSPMYADPVMDKDKMDHIIEQNQAAISMMKARMVTNLLL